jgi:hypothetical protein
MQLKIFFISGLTSEVETTVTLKEIAGFMKGKKITVSKNSIINWGYVENAIELSKIKEMEGKV